MANLTLSGQVVVVMKPEDIARFMRDRGGPVMRHLIVEAEKVKVEAIRTSPRRTGNMANHIVKRVTDIGGEPAVLVGVDTSIVPYAYWVHEGAVPHDIPRTGKLQVFFWKKTGRVMFLRKTTPIHHPGSKGNPWLVRALHVLRC